MQVCKVVRVRSNANGMYRAKTKYCSLLLFVFSFSRFLGGFFCMKRYT